MVQILVICLSHDTILLLFQVAQEEDGLVVLVVQEIPLLILNQDVLISLNLIRVLKELLVVIVFLVHHHLLQLKSLVKVVGVVDQALMLVMEIVEDQVAEAAEAVLLHLIRVMQLTHLLLIQELVIH